MSNSDTVTCEVFCALLPVPSALLEAMTTGFFPTHSYSISVWFNDSSPVGN